MNAFLSAEVSRMGSEIRRVGTDVQTVQQAIHKLSPRDISDPFFYVRNPLGERIPILLSHYHIFDDLDRILRAYLYKRPDAGSTYVERGDYSIVSTDGAIIPRLKLRGELRAGIEFDMSIIKREHWRPTTRACPHCHKIDRDAVEGSWVNCSNVTCGTRYQVSKIEEISSPQISRRGRAAPVRQEDQAESFRLVQIFYVEGRVPAITGPSRGLKLLSPKIGSVKPKAEINSAASQIYEVSDEARPVGGDDN
ncbi:hypothetical protein B0H14DRAFT_3000610 [Mycena olivaceomarginata]|nr:hypothetical protein B0H14DRAFT_3000610 [Mycena olivaceomarginata]